MKLRLFFFTLSLMFSGVILAQGNLPVGDGFVRDAYKTNNNNWLAPFNLGVASGDPSHESVVIWTRVQGDSVNDVKGFYYVALDTAFTQMVTSGSFTTGPQANYTIKININNLTPDTYYYYHFSALGKNSLTGRTKTAPLTTPSENQLKFAVLSCQNYEHGFFNLLGEFANFNDIDAVLHLGDYIYEYKKNQPIGGREHDTIEAFTLKSYRERYTLYKSDTDLIRIHQQYPFIQIWDDHEVADNAWMNGADNHNPATEGPWNIRKSAGYRAFYEFQPMWPAQDSSVYRSIKYGSLADIILLDTRFHGREKQIYDVTDSLVYDTARTILGNQQYNWFTNQLSNSTAQWKLIANQVFFSPYHIGWAAVPPVTAHQLESNLLDMWDGYPAERKKIIQHIKTQQINNVLILTGDIHTAYAAEVADPVNDTANGYALLPNYNPATAAGAEAVEFVTPSITSANFDERIPPWAAAILEQQFNSPLANGNVPNPHVKYVDLDRHGGIILTIDSTQAQADYYYAATILSALDSMYFDTAMYVLSNTHLLNAKGVKATAKVNSPTPAPLKPRGHVIGINENTLVYDFVVYPNPANDVLKIDWKKQGRGAVEIQIYDLTGVVFLRKLFANAVEIENINIAKLPAGIYFLALTADGEKHVRKIEVVR